MTNHDLKLRLTVHERLSEKPRVAIGLDGFVDRIAHRVTGAGGAPFDTMTAFGERLIELQERSSTFGLAQIDVRLGGNMPNTAMTLARLGVSQCCIGALGHPGIHPAFAPLKQCVELISYAEPGECLALEFQDCKAFFSDNGDLERMDWPLFLERVGLDRLLGALDGAAALCLLNWGEIESMQRLWHGIATEILPQLREKPRHILIDTADATGRSGADVAALFDTMRLLKANARLVLSVNDGELRSLADALGIADGEPDTRCRALLDTGAMDALVLHSARHAEHFGAEGEAWLPTRYTQSPMLLTGGGDNFNAGFLLGLLLGLAPIDCLKTGNAASSHYVHSGRSPEISDLIEEIARSEELWQGARERG